MKISLIFLLAFVWMTWIILTWTGGGSLIRWMFLTMMNTTDSCITIHGTLDIGFSETGHTNEVIGEHTLAFIHHWLESWKTRAGDGTPV